MFDSALRKVLRVSKSDLKEMLAEEKLSENEVSRSRGRNRTLEPKARLGKRVRAFICESQTR